MVNRMIHACLWALIELGLTLAATLALGADVRPVLVEDECDLIHVNHFHDESGRLIFTQVIFCDLAADGIYDVLAWRMVRGVSQIPTPTRDGRWETVWHDGETLRRVRSAIVQESHTLHDPELEARERLPSEHRRELCCRRQP